MKADIILVDGKLKELNDGDIVKVSCKEASLNVIQIAKVV